MENAVTQLPGSPIVVESTAESRSGQFNLFTGEVEPIPGMGELEPQPETPWLFDPDFGLVLPEDRAGKEILVEEGIALSFPGEQVSGVGFQVSGGRARAFEDRLPARPQAITNHQSQITNPTERLVFGRKPFVPERPRVAKTADLAQVILSGFGIYLGKKSERLQIKVAGKVAKDANGSTYEFPLFRLSEVVIASRGVSFSSDLLEEFCERGIRLTFLDYAGRPYAMLSSPTLTATVESRREQLKAFDDARGLEFARAVVRGKIRNQRHLLLYCGKYLKQSDPERFEALADLAKQLRQLEVKARKAGKREQGTGDREQVPGVRSEVPGKPEPSPQNLEPDTRLLTPDTSHLTPGTRSELLGLEGVAGRVYWQGFKMIVEGKAEFMGRVHRGADDPLNALLNYGYGILYGHVWGAVANAGLEPFAGFLHVDRPGKPSLVLDLVEEFRQPVVDRTVIAFINLGQKTEMKEGLLDEDTRKAIAEKVLARLASTEEFRGQQYQIRSIVQMQARALVSFLRGKGSYKPFSFRW
jgi:CRISPR-associated protein Cas1